MSGSAYWHVIVAQDRINHVRNPSFEFGTEGWQLSGTGIEPPVWGTSSWFAYDGASGLACRTAGSAGTWNIVSDRWSVVRSPSSPPHYYTLTTYIANYASGTVTAVLREVNDAGTSGTFLIPPDGSWRPVTVTGTRATETPAGALTIFKPFAGAGSVAVDAWLYEDGTTAMHYFDGDWEHGTWRGYPHLDDSAISRAGRTGRIVSLASLGLLVEDHAGIGAPPVEAVADAEASIGTRVLTLRGVLLGTSTAGLHATRERVLRHLAPWGVDGIAPVRLAYAGASGTWTIDAVYQGGLDVSEMGVAHERATLTFRAVDPYWRTMRRYGHQAKDPVISVPAGVSARDPAGSQIGILFWPTISPPIIRHVNADRPGTLVVCGDFGTVNGTVAPGVAFVVDGTVMPLRRPDGGCGIPSGTVYASRWTPARTIALFGYAMASPSGTAPLYELGWPSTCGGTFSITPRYGTFTAASSPGAPAALFDGVYVGVGTLFAVGDVAGGIVFGGSTTGLGTLNGWTFALARVTTDEVVVVGSFTQAGGTNCRHIASYNFAARQWGTYRWDPGTPIAAVAASARQEVYAYVIHGDAGTRGIWQVRRGQAEQLQGVSWKSIWYQPQYLMARPLAVAPNGALSAIVNMINALGTQEFSYEESPFTCYIAHWGRAQWKFNAINTWSGSMHGISYSPDGTLYTYGAYGAFSESFEAEACIDIQYPFTAPTFVLAQFTNHWPFEAYYLASRLFKLENMRSGRGVYGRMMARSYELCRIDARTNTVTHQTAGNMQSRLGITSSARNVQLYPGTNRFAVAALTLDRIVFSWRGAALSPDGTMP